MWAIQSERVWLGQVKASRRDTHVGPQLRPSHYLHWQSHYLQPNLTVSKHLPPHYVYQMPQGEISPTYFNWQMFKNLFHRDRWDHDQVENALSTLKCPRMTPEIKAGSSVRWYFHSAPNGKGRQGKEYVLVTPIDFANFSSFYPILAQTGRKSWLMQLYRGGQSVAWKVESQTVVCHPQKRLRMKNSGISKEPPPHRNIKLFIFWPNKPDSRLEVAHMEEAMKSFFLSAGEGVQEPAIIKSSEGCLKLC